jgi:hypothetical protein
VHDVFPPGDKEEAQGLNVVSQEVVYIKSGASDGRHLSEASMRSVPVVLVDPGFEVRVSLLRGLVEASISPLTDGGLDESFGLAVGAGSVDAGADVSDLQGFASSLE